MDDDDTVFGSETSRREAIKTALKIGAYATPVIVAASVPVPLAAQVSGPTGTLTGIISNSTNGLPIPGATVAVGAVSALTNASGVYTIPNAPSGTRTVTTSAAGFSTRTDTVIIAAGATTTFSTTLVPGTSSGNLTIILNWGAVPTDLDSHLVGPNSAGGRFHCFYAARTPVSYVSLDVDDVTSFGPETITVSTLSGNFVAGSYNYYVHNFSGSPAFDVSGASITVFQGGVQLAQFLVSAATGSPALVLWSVFSFTLTATPTGGIVITPVQQFVSTAPTIVLGEDKPLPSLKPR